MHKCSRKTKFNLSEFANANAVLFVCSRGFCTAPLLLLVLLTQRRGIARISLDFGSIVAYWVYFYPRHQAYNLFIYKACV